MKAHTQTLADDRGREDSRPFCLVWQALRPFIRFESPPPW